MIIGEKVAMKRQALVSATTYDFKFSTTLTTLHFIVIVLVGFIPNAIGYFASKNVQLWDVLWLYNCIQHAFVEMNISLLLNSIEFY